MCQILLIYLSVLIQDYQLYVHAEYRLQLRLSFEPPPNLHQQNAHEGCRLLLMYNPDLNRCYPPSDREVRLVQLKYYLGLNRCYLHRGHVNCPELQENFLLLRE